MWLSIALHPSHKASAFSAYEGRSIGLQAERRIYKEYGVGFTLWPRTCTFVASVTEQQTLNLDLSVRHLGPASARAATPIVNRCTRALSWQPADATMPL